MQDSPQTPAAATAQVELMPSLDLALDLTREQSEIQRDYNKTLDTKFNFVLTSASFLVAAATLVNGMTITGFYSVVARGIAVASVVVYCLVGFAVYCGYRIRDFETVPDPARLGERYLKESVQYTKQQVFETMCESYEYNDTLLTGKLKWLHRAIDGLLLQIAATLALAITLALR